MGQGRAPQRAQGAPAQAMDYDRQCPLAPVQHRFAWHHLVSFVHPTSGRTALHLVSSVSIPLFEVERAEYTCQVGAGQVGAGPIKEIILVLDWAGWHTSMRLPVPEQVHLLFLPASSPAL